MRVTSARSRTEMGEGRENSQQNHADPSCHQSDVHDLRHEAGSRWLEAGWPIHHVAGQGNAWARQHQPDSHLLERWADRTARVRSRNPLYKSPLKSIGLCTTVKPTNRRK